MFINSKEHFEEEFRNTGMESGANRQILVSNEIQFLLASRPEGWDNFGIDSPVMWIEKCGGWFREITDKNPGLIEIFETGDENKRKEILDEIGEQIKSKLLH